MIDTIHLRIDRMVQDQFDLIPQIWDSTVKEEIVTYKDQYNKYGKLGNLTVILNDTCLKIKGSLSGFLWGTNLIDLKKGEIAIALHRIEEYLGISLKFAKVTRLDFGKNLIMDHCPSSYMNLLSDVKHLTRFEKAGSVYYENKGRSLLFYDKTLETIAKKGSFPPDLRDKHILRYEARWLKNLGRLARTGSSLWVHQIITDEFYDQLETYWKEQYSLINKIPEYCLSTSVTKPSEFVKYLSAEKIRDLGLNNALKMVNELKARNQLSNSASYSKLKRTLRELSHRFNDPEVHGYIEELDEKILNSY